MQTAELEEEDRAAHGEWTKWKGFRAEIEDHSGDKGEGVDDGKVLQLGCGYDSIRMMRGEMTLPEMLEINQEERSQNNARYTGFAGKGQFF